MRRKTHTAGLALAIALLLAGVPAATEGQDSETPLFVTIPESFPNVEAKFLLLREPGREIVVLNPASASVDELGTGLSLLARLRRERGRPTRGQMIPVVGYAGSLNLSEERRTRLEAALVELRARPLSNVGNLGRGRWMRLDAR
jgi:hypothetical protein